MYETPILYPGTWVDDELCFAVRRSAYYPHGGMHWRYPLRSRASHMTGQVQAIPAYAIYFWHGRNSPEGSPTALEAQRCCFGCPVTRARVRVRGRKTKGTEVEGCLRSSSCLAWESTPLWVAAGSAMKVLPKTHLDAGPPDWSGIQAWEAPASGSNRGRIHRLIHADAGETGGGIATH